MTIGIVNRKNISLEKLSPILNELINNNIDVTITVTGISMGPLWRHKRDSVVLTKCDKSSLKKGDIPLYIRLDGKYVMHRIINVKENSYDLCGDNQINIEYGLPKECVLAVVKSFTRNGKKYSCNSLLFQIYSTAWIGLLPLRRIILKIYIKLSGIIK